MSERDAVSECTGSPTEFQLMLTVVCVYAREVEWHPASKKLAGNVTTAVLGHLVNRRVAPE